MAHVSLRQLGLHCVTAVLTPLPYNSIKLYCANTKLNLILVYRHAHCIESFFYKCNQQPVCNKIICIYNNTVIYVTSFEIYYTTAVAVLAFIEYNFSTIYGYKQLRYYSSCTYTPTCKSHF